MPKHPNTDAQPIYYVYVLFDWRGIPRWIGHGKGKRFYHSERYYSTNLKKKSFSGETKRILGEVPKLKIRENLTRFEAKQLEMILIKAIGRFPSGPLVNMNDGPSAGFNMTLEERQIAGRKGALALTKEQRTEYLTQGPKAIRGGIWINDGKTNKRLRQDEFIPVGWKEGRTAGTTNGTRWINNGVATKLLNPTEALPEGWVFGHLRNSAAKKNGKWINNGNTTRFLSSNNVLPDGWNYGRRLKP